VEGAGKAGRLHALYNWGATVTLVTHAAAEKAGVERNRQPAAAIAGLGSRCTMVNSYYMVLVVDGKDEVRYSVVYVFQQLFCLDKKSELADVSYVAIANVSLPSMQNHMRMHIKTCPDNFM
jgi:hypothetical protein